jgi:hypothetical protein
MIHAWEGAMSGRYCAISLCTTLFCTIAFIAVAQEIPDYSKVVACKSVKDDADRLRCFDRALSAPGRQFHSGDQIGHVEQNWLVSESKSPIDDSLRISAVLESTEKNAGLVLRCHEKITDAYVHFRNYLGSAESLRLIYRINTDKAVETRWTPSREGAAVFVPTMPLAITFIRSLPDNGTLFVRVHDFQGNSEDVTFELGPASEVRAKLAGACSWPTPNQALAPAPAPSTKTSSIKLIATPSHQQKWSVAAQRR